MELTAFWNTHHSAALAFSGGVDSAYLLYSAITAGADVTAYYVKTDFQPRFELEDAKKLADRLGAKLVVIEHPILDAPCVAENPADRCYHCKQALFRALIGRARADGYRVVLDGTNTSDDAGDRPGMRALQELQVLSPLRLCGLTKDEIRRRSKEAGLFTWDKPAYACLATRFPTGMAITASALQAVEAAESFLFSLGFTDFRVRRTEGGATLQMPEAQLSSVLARRTQILDALQPLLGTVTLDLQPRAVEELPQDGVSDEVVELRCNLDDITGEDIAFAAEILLEQGALDVWTTPIQMKKGRPAVLLSCLCRPEDAERFTLLMLRHTTTLGVRQSLCRRTCLRRTTREDGGIRIKQAEGFGIYKEKAEFDDLSAAARSEGCSLAEIRRKHG